MPTTFIPIPISAVVEEPEKPSKTYAIDLDRGRIVGHVDGIGAVQQAIRKALITPRFKCLVYDNQYGSEIKDLIITKDATRELIETELPRLVEDALLPDTRILGVRDFSFSFEDEKAYIKFTADTIYGQTAIEEVI